MNAHLAPIARRLGLVVILLVAAAKLALHLATSGAFGYGFFVDELYYLEASRHLAWGFVDFPPIFPALSALVRSTLGDSLLATRLTPALAGAALVVLTGLLARRLGGGAFAQALAALAVLTAPIYLALHGIHTMNALEPLLWTGCAWCLVEILDGKSGRWWLALGALGGVGLLNKHSMAFFGVALVAGVLATPARRALGERWIWLGGALALLIFLPNLIWVAAHGFPHLEMLRNIAENDRNVALSPLAFMGQQALMLHPLSLPIWLAGLFWLGWARAGRYRALAVAYPALILLMLLLDGRMYYPAPVYPILLAAGAVAISEWLEARRWRWMRAAYPALLLVGGAILAPLFVPCLPPETFRRYSRAIGIEQPRIETHELGPLPQLFADRFGWPEMAAAVAKVYHALPPEERARAAIFGQNYGQAGAIDLFGPKLGLPPAVSGHLAYHDWGPRGFSGEVVIVLDDDRETLERLFERVEWAGRVEHPYSMPYQRFDIHVARGLRVPLAEAWPALRQLD